MTVSLETLQESTRALKPAPLVQEFFNAKPDIKAEWFAWLDERRTKLAEKAEAISGGSITRSLGVHVVAQMKASGYHDGWGLSPAKYRGRQDFRIVDYKPANWKRPWIAENRAGKRYKWSDEDAREMWGGPAPMKPVTPPPISAAAAAYDYSKDAEF